MYTLNDEVGAGLFPGVNVAREAPPAAADSSQSIAGRAPRGAPVPATTEAYLQRECGNDPRN